MNIDPATLSLKPILTPSPVSWWPPAMGWWLIGGGILCLCFAGLFYYGLSRKKLKRQTIRSFQLVYEAYLKDGKKSKCIQGFSYILRQVIFHKTPEPASKTGADWLSQLERNLADKPFTIGVGKCFEKGPYLPESASEDIPIEAIYALCLRWAKTL